MLGGDARSGRGGAAELLRYRTGVREAEGPPVQLNLLNLLDYLMDHNTCSIRSTGRFMQMIWGVHSGIKGIHSGIKGIHSGIKGVHSGTS